MVTWPAVAMLRRSTRATTRQPRSCTRFRLRPGAGPALAPLGASLPAPPAEGQGAAVGRARKRSPLLEIKHRTGRRPDGQRGGAPQRPLTPDGVAGHRCTHTLTELVEATRGTSTWEAAKFANRATSELARPQTREGDVTGRTRVTFDADDRQRHPSASDGSGSPG